ncbi:MAG: hypothetical protein HYZ29_09440 [Myxococcales bacterium]|nr:hypothetical protein [Myxococcales bacterium]
MGTGAGMIVSVRGEPRFLPALVVHSVHARPRLSAVPGSPLSMAWVAGKVVPVARLGDTGPHLVVCLSAGEVVGLWGVEVLDTGFFEKGEGGVEHSGRTVAPLDVTAEIEKALETSA